MASCRENRDLFNTDGVTQMSESQSSFRAWEILLIVLLAGSVVLNVVLSREVRDLKDHVLTITSEGRLLPGAQVPPIRGTDPAGNPATIAVEATELPTLVYIFSSDCGWCRRNHDNVRALAKSVGDTHHWIGLSLDNESVGQYMAENDLDFPYLTHISPQTLQAYKLGGTPQTLLISPDGTVLMNWMGAYMDAVEESIEKQFGVELPGLLEPQKDVLAETS